MSLTYQINEASVIHEIIEGDAIMINLDSGNYYSLNETGTFVWSCLERGATIEQVAAFFAERFAQPLSLVATQCQSFIQQLLDEKLIAPAPSPATAQAADWHMQESAYSPPKLSVFSDMQELLLLDPIHETGGLGWPSAASKKQ